MNEKHEKLKEDVEGLELSADPMGLEQRIHEIDEEINSMKENIPTISTKNDSPPSKPCNKCRETFSKNFELENLTLRSASFCMKERNVLMMK